MFRILIIIIVLLIPTVSIAKERIRVRLYADQATRSAILSVTDGEYEVKTPGNTSLVLKKNEQVAFSVFKGRIAVKPGDHSGFACDSVRINGMTGNDSFSLRVIDGNTGSRLYRGDLQCLFDLGLIVFINTCDTESYIAGVVKAEGGPGINAEYCKAQAVLARSYLYRNIERHNLDNYNVCDNIHCQAFYGITDDAVILRAATGTKDLVVLDRRNNSVIVPAFHSNCGGMTSNSEDVWLADLPYLKKIQDPHCLASRNAKWNMSIPVPEWIAYLKESGYKTELKDPSVLSFSQITRLAEYRIGTFAIPFRQIRTDLNLRSSFFSVFVEGDRVKLMGRGYGHGVGLCQEGAMVMAAKGFSFKQIIEFYFAGVVISDIKNAAPPEKSLFAESIENEQ